MSKLEQVVVNLSAALKLAHEQGEDELAYLLGVAHREAVSRLMEEWGNGEEAA